MASPGANTGANPSSKSRWTARMGSVMRRTSSVMAISRPATPSIGSDRDADATSLKQKKFDITAAAVSAPGPRLPSPVAETPAPEAITSIDADAEMGLSAPSLPAQAPQPSALGEPTSSLGYFPPPIIDAAAGNPGIFTDEVDELPQPASVHNPYASDASLIHGREHADGVSEVVHTDEREIMAKPVQVVEPVEIGTTEHIAQPSIYFDKPVVESIDNNSVDEVTEPLAQAARESTVLGGAAAYNRESQSSTVFPEPQGTSDRVGENHDGQVNEEIPSDRSSAEEGFRFPRTSVEWGSGLRKEGQAESHHLSKYDLSTDRGEPRGRISQETRHSYHDPNEDGSQTHNLGYRTEDSHAKLTARRTSIPDRTAVDHKVALPNVDIPTDHNRALDVTHGDACGRVQMPLLPSDCVVHLPSQNYRNHITDETQPLLGHAGLTSYLQPQNGRAAKPQSFPLPSSNGTLTAYPAAGAFVSMGPHAFGYVEYRLPDGERYYVDHTERSVVDLDLRDDLNVRAVEVVVKSSGRAMDCSLGMGVGVVTNVALGIVQATGAGKADGSNGAGREIWIRDDRKKQGKNVLMSRWCVDHADRSVHFLGTGGKTGRGKTQEDQLDMEYRYWTFVETHPSHLALTAATLDEAGQILEWAMMDGLLPAYISISAPFTRDECSNLLAILRPSNITDDRTDGVIRTRVVARIFVRLLQWRQHHFRSGKPLPRDALPRRCLQPTSRPLWRALFDFVISCACLGLPYLFLQRAHRGQQDVEGGLRSAGPFMMIGVCSCLVAAVVLSASVTFLSLPGLDRPARVAGLVAILCAFLAMASTVVAIFRFKADRELGIYARSHISFPREGMVGLTGCSLLYSLPLVCVSYALVAFVVAIALYSSHIVTNPHTVSLQHHFGDHTWRTVMSAVGALGGLLAVSLWILRP